MADETDFLNDALGQVGASAISAIDDGSTNAEYCRRFWPPLRRAMIRSHHWNFAMHRIALAQDNTTPPVYGFALSYSLPAGYLKIVEYNGAPAAVNEVVLPAFPLISRYEIEGGKLLTNDIQVFVKYLKDETNPDIWDPLFYQAASSWLASKLVAAIQKSEKMATLKLREAMEIFLPLAMAVDGQEGTEVASVIDDLLRVR